MKLAITGCTGFIGRALREEAGRRGHAVIAIVRSPDPAFAGEQRVAPDLLTCDDVGALVRGADAVVNLAARVHVREKADEASERAHDAMNHRFPARLAEAAKAESVGVFVQLSSVAAIASATDPGETADDDTPPRPAGAYGRAKLAADRGLATLIGPSFSVISLRPPAVFGDGASRDFRLLTTAAAKGLPLPLGALTNRRSIILIDNLVDAILAACQRPKSGAYIVTDSGPMTIATLYRALLARHGRGDRTFGLPQALMRPAARLVLGERANSIFGGAAFDGGRFMRDFGWTPPRAMPAAIAEPVAA